MRGGNVAGVGSSFDTLFGQDSSGGGEGDEADGPPSVHKLFNDALDDRQGLNRTCRKLSLPQLARALFELHGVHLTPAAAKLLSSVDAASGRLSFAQFQRALQQGDAGPLGGAGQRTVFKDQARAIIADNCGAPSAPPPQCSTKLSTDISAEREAFNRSSKVVEKGQSKGAFAANPVLKTNKASRTNPMLGSGGGAPSEEDACGAREMAQTATRMYVSGELDRAGFEKFLIRCGIALEAESELSRLINNHERTGESKFVDFARALQRELAKAGA